MRWPKAHRQVKEPERGASATLFAIFLTGGVLMAMLAISVDIGNLTYERRQLQNSADASSLALAAECAENTTLAPCAKEQVQDLLDANAHDNATQYDAARVGDGACASPAVGSLPLCPPPSTDAEDLAECTPLPTLLAGVPYVETYTETNTPANGDKLFMPFSRALGVGDQGTKACARAAWGVPDGFAGAFPLTISGCEWSNATQDGADFVPNGPGAGGYGGANPWPPVTKEIVLEVQNNHSDDACTDFNGHDFPGGFGWLETDGTCQAVVSPSDWVKVNPGNGPDTSACGDQLDVLNKVIDIPVYDCFARDSEPTGPPAGCPATDATAGGNKTWYHLVGWAKFYVSGVKYTGSQSASSTLPGSTNSCGGSGGSGRCVIGWFLSGPLAENPNLVLAPPGSGNNFGAYIIKPAG